MTAHEIMTVSDEMKKFFEEKTERREIIEDICAFLKFEGHEIVIAYCCTQYRIKIINSEKITCLWASTPELVLGMLYAIAMYI